MIIDTNSTKDAIAHIPSRWPAEIRKQISIEYIEESYPSDRRNLRSLWRVCATQRLFVPAMLPDEDSIIYIDNDMLFMRPPEELWEEFTKFDSIQVAGISPYVKDLVLAKGVNIIVVFPACLSIVV